MGDSSILVHCCCGPCSLYTVKVIVEAGLVPTGFFFNPNIHPFREFERRVEAMEEVAAAFAMPMVWDERGYDLKGWLAAVGDDLDPPLRCRACYRIRLEETVRRARAMGVRRFTTTLLYSRYQQHEAIKEMCREMAVTSGVEFYYRDFRVGWAEGIQRAREMGIYRQPYCGCIFSERERYAKRERRLMERLESGKEVMR